MSDLAPNGPPIDAVSRGGVDPSDQVPSRASSAGSAASREDRIRTLRAAIAQDPDGFIERRLGRALEKAISGIQ